MYSTDDEVDVLYSFWLVLCRLLAPRASRTAKASRIVSADWFGAAIEELNGPIHGDVRAFIDKYGRHG